MVGPTLVLGATGGIGRALCRQLAAAGKPLFLIARDSHSLSQLANEIGAGYAAADVLDETSLREAVAHASNMADGRLAGLA